MQPDPAPFRLFQFKRNASYAASVRLAARYGLWWAPSTLLQAIRLPLLGMVEGLGIFLLGLIAVPFAILAWIVVNLAVLIFGVLGFLVPADDNQS